jgi:hypothetical protein
MTTTAIRKKLITYIADADDKKVKGLYMLVEDDIDTTPEFVLNNEYLKILESDRDEHIKGKSKSYTREEAKQIVRGKRKL